MGSMQRVKRTRLFKLCPSHTTGVATILFPTDSIPARAWVLPFDTISKVGSFRSPLPLLAVPDRAIVDASRTRVVSNARSRLVKSCVRISRSRHDRHRSMERRLRAQKVPRHQSSLFGCAGFPPRAYRTISRSATLLPRSGRTRIRSCNPWRMGSMIVSAMRSEGPSILLTSSSPTIATASSNICGEGNLIRPRIMNLVILAWSIGLV